MSARNLSESRVFKSVRLAAASLAAVVALAVAPILADPASANGEPSNSPVPTTPPSGYTLAFADDFPGTSLSYKWGKYSGVPGGDPAGLWAPSHAQVKGGLLTLRGYKNSKGQYVTAGVSTEHGLNQRYGKYLVRMRMDEGEGISYATLLWPTDSSGPPEIDFAEDNGAASRSTLTSFMHYGTSAKKQQVRKEISVDMSKWHTVGVEWSPLKLTYTLDGRPWAVVTGNGVSTKSMYLALQTQAWPCGGSYNKCPVASTPANVDMQVDWVVAYEPK